MHYENLANVRATIQTREKNSEVQSSIISSIAKNQLRKSKDSASKGNKIILAEHLSNIKHMNRRIQSIGSYNERKKNQFDPITHPVVFFRGKYEAEDLALDQRFIEKSVRPPKTNKVYEDGLRGARKRPSTSLDVRIEVPFIDKNEKNAGVKLRELLLDTVVKNRIYREDDLQDLFRHTRQANSHLDLQTLESAIGFVYNEITS